MKHPSLRFVRGPIVALLVLTATTPVGAEESEDCERSIEDKIDRFELWHACEPIYLIVGSLPDHAAEWGLTREAITATVRSRLRAARLYSRTPSRSFPHRPGSMVHLSAFRAWLYVHVNTLSEGRAFNVSLEFKKRLPDRLPGRLRDPARSGEAGRATTWNTRTVGQGDADYILSTVSQLTDEFIDAYLRVNASACQGPGQR